MIRCGTTRRRLIGGTALAALMMGAQSGHADDFRVFPYLQNPSSDGMLFTWFTEADVAGTLTITGGDLGAPFVVNSAPEFQPKLAYTQTEVNDAIAKGYPVLGDTNYKHSVPVSGLSPNTKYTYSVQQDGSVFQSTFSTAPTADDWSHVRFVALSDSETEPRGNTNQRDWQVGGQAPGSLGRPSDWPKDGAGRDLYPLTETTGYQQNLRIIRERDPDLIVMPGDLVQGGGYQLGWDEFFRHNAGEFDTPLSERPIVPALGNWENFGAINGGYGVLAETGEFGPLKGREKYKVYYDAPSNGTPAHQDNYYRIDYGPVTILTMDSSNGEPDQTRFDPDALDTDTQSNFTREQYESFGGTDLSDFNEGSVQYNWVVEQLEDAREAGQIIFVQFHHAPYTSGTHSLPMSDPATSGQAGTPLRQYSDEFEEYGVAAVLSGHSEMFERSFVDLDGDGIGVHYYDVGVAGDGMRGVRSQDPDVRKELNPFSQWTADLDEGELWLDVDDGAGGTYRMLVDGGKHYGHLEVNLTKLPEGSNFLARLDLTPVYSFPILDADYTLVGDTERRVYGDQVRLLIGFDGAVTAVPVWSGTGLLALLGGTLLMRAVGRSRRP